MALLAKFFLLLYVQTRFREEAFVVKLADGRGERGLVCGLQANETKGGVGKLEWR